MPNNQENGNRSKMSIITLNLNGLNVPTKRHRLTEWKTNKQTKKDPYICCLQETHFRPKDTYRLKVRRWKNTFHANGKQKKAGVAILISDKIGLKIKNSTRDKEGQGISPRGRHKNCKYLCTQDHGTWSHYFMANKWETVSDFIFGGLQNHCRW